MTICLPSSTASWAGCGSVFNILCSFVQVSAGFSLLILAAKNMVKMPNISKA